MPFTNTPVQSTYTTRRFDFYGTPGQRSGTNAGQDERYVNLFPEKVPGGEKGKYYLRERPGTLFDQATGFSGVGRGITTFNGYTYSAIGNQLYRNNVAVATLGNSTGRVGFTLYNGTYTALIVLDGVNGYVVKTDNTVTQIVSANFPTPHLPFPIYIDGYIFVTKATTNDTYNSNLLDPLTWTPGNFITSELYPGTLMGLVKNNNYLITIGSASIEFFYDAGIASGSPLQRNDSAVQQMGCAAMGSIVETDKEVLFVGDTNNGGRTVWAFAGFTPDSIATPAVAQSLDEEGTNISSASAFCVRSKGHKFYVLNLTTRTWVYDFDEKMWHEWSYINTSTPFYIKYACDHTDGHSRALHPSNGNILKFSETTAADAVTNATSNPIYCQATTGKIDFSSNNRKACSRLSLVCDAPNAAADTNLSVQWSDDDYQTWTPNRTLLVHGEISAINQLGQFRRRAFRFTYLAAYPIRLEGYELDVNIGNS